MTNPLHDPLLTQTEQNAYDRGYFAGYATAEVNAKKAARKRWPTWARVTVHGVAYLAVLFIGISMGSGSAQQGMQQGYQAAGGPGASVVPTSARGATQSMVTTATTPAAVSAKQVALDKLFVETQKRGSLAHLSEDQLKTVMDTFVCKHVDDLMALSSGGAGISGNDAGYIWGMNAVVGYC